MAPTLDLDASFAVLCAAGAVCRRERDQRQALARLLTSPRDAEAWAAARASVSPGQEAALRADLDLLETVSRSGSAGSARGGSPRTPSIQEEPC